MSILRIPAWVDPINMITILLSAEVLGLYSRERPVYKNKFAGFRQGDNLLYWTNRTPENVQLMTLMIIDA